jgi:hypothetical protein
VEIGPKHANLLRDIARARGLSEEEVLEEALLLYLESSKRATSIEGSDDVDVAAWVNERTAATEERPPDGFLALLDRMHDRFGLDEDEAMRIAVEEQHAFRRERAAREQAER